MSDTQNEKIPETNVDEKKETFASGLFALMTKQCIFSALLLGIIYLFKNIPLTFFESLCSVIKNIINFNITPDNIKNLFTGLFL